MRPPKDQHPLVGAAHGLALGVAVVGGTAGVTIVALALVAFSVFLVIRFGFWVVLASIPVVLLVAWVVETAKRRRGIHNDPREETRFAREMERRKVAAFLGRWSAWKRDEGHDGRRKRD